MRDSILSLIMLIAFVTSTRAFAQQIHLPPMVQQGPNIQRTDIDSGRGGTGASKKGLRISRWVRGIRRIGEINR